MSTSARLDLVDAASIALLVGASAVTAALFSALPARIPIHFDLHGAVDGWSSRAFGAALLPSCALGGWVLLRFGGRVAGSTFRESLAASPMRLVALLTTSLLIALHFVLLWSALHHGHRVGPALGVALGAFTVVLALVLPRVRRNPFVGVRTAWTLSSDENWARTHRVAGWTFFVGGLAAIAAALAGAPALSIASVVGSAVVPAVYSWLVSRRLPPV